MWAESWGSTDTLLSAFNALGCGDGVKRPGSVMATEGGKPREGDCLGSWGSKRLGNTSSVSLVILFLS